MSSIAIALIALMAQVPQSHPDVQWSIVTLQTCDSLAKLVPDAAVRLATSPPAVYLAALDAHICGQYVPELNIMYLRSDWVDGCKTKREIIAHELLHYLGIHHHNDPDLTYTVFDPVHEVLKECLRGDYHFPTRQINTPNVLSPWTKGNGQ